MLRKLTLADVPDFTALSFDPEATRFLTWGPHVTQEETENSIRYVLRAYEEKQVGPWGIEAKSDGRCIGSCGFNWWQPRHARAELSYMVARPYWGQGLTTEAVREVIRFGFTVMDLNRIEALVSPRNTASVRVLEKAGMNAEGVLRECISVKGVLEDHVMYAILRRAWVT